MLELEINEWLDCAALYLNNDENNSNDEHGINSYIAMAQTCNNAFLPTVGKEMTDKTEHHYCKDIFISNNNLAEEFWMEVGKNLP
jgi:hypothetical protein